MRPIGLEGNAFMGKSNSDRTEQTVSRSRRPGRIILKYLLLLIILLSCLPFLLPKLISSDYIRHKALDLLGQELGHHMGVDHIAMTFFPRPGFRLEGLIIYPRDTIGIGIKTALFFPNIGTLFSQKTFPLAGELILKQITPVSPEQNTTPPLPLPLEAFKGSAIETLAINFSYTSLQQFSLNIRGAHLRIASKIHPDHPIYARSLGAKIKKKPEMLSITLEPTQFAPPLLLGVRFQRDNTAHTSQLSFTGQNVSVIPLRAMATTFFKKNAIVATLFHIIRKGTIPHIKVDFKNSDDKFLFDPKKMHIDAQLHGGTIAIPSTRLVAKDVTATVQVKNGLLLPQISQGTLEEAQIKQGTLQVDLLGKNAFKGKFFLDANLAKLPGVLQSLLPNTPLARELELTKNITGTTSGTLELAKKGGKLKVKVNCTHIDMTGSYQRFPDKFFHLKGNAFSFEKDKITLKEISGTIGSSQISQISGKINLTSPHLIDITTARGIFPIQNILTWVAQFQPIGPLVTPFLSSRGTLTLDHMALKGALSDPNQWTYAAQGYCSQGEFYQTHGKKGISDISFSFDLLPHAFKLENIKGTIQAMGPLFENNTNRLNTPQFQLLRGLKTPITLTDGTLGKKNEVLSFQCRATFPQGASITLGGTGNNENIILKKLEIKESHLSSAQVSYHPGGPLIFKGKVNLETIRQLFKLGSTAADALRLPSTQGTCFLSSSPEKGVTLFLERLNLNAFLSATDTDKKEEPLPQKNKDISQDNALHGKKMPLKTEQASENKANGMAGKENGSSQIPYVDMIPRPTLVTIGTLEFSHFLISPLALQLFPLPTGTDVAIQDSRWCGLPLMGVIRKEANTLKLTLETDAQDLDFTTSLKCFMGNHHLIEGKYAIKATLFSRSQGKTNQGAQLISGFQGSFELYAREGRIFKMTLLSRVLSLINVSSLLKAKLPDLLQEGFAYDTMIFKGNIKESRIFIQKGVISGVDMTLLITGWIDPLEKTMDLLCFVSPLKSVDTLIQKLPIINTMFQGNLISIPITVKGNLYDPDVITLPPVEVTKGIFNTLKDILSTPLTLLKKLP